MKPTRHIYDPLGYDGPLRYTEIMIGAKFHRGSGVWSDTTDLMTLVWDAAFVTRQPLKDSHAQLAHYARSFDLYDKEDEGRRAELLERIETIPHLANFAVDIDYKDDLPTAQSEAIRLVNYYRSLGIAEPAILVHFSGKKGFAVTLPWQVVGVPATGVPRLNWGAYKELAVVLQAKLGLNGLDMGLYKRNATHRLENTLHPSGLVKVRLTLDELQSPIENILKLAEAPRKPLYDFEVESELRQVRCEPLYATLYMPSQVKADVEGRKRMVEAKPLSPEVLEELAGTLPHCLQEISRSNPTEGDRNNTAFYVASMMKKINRDPTEAKGFLKDWLGNQYGAAGADATVDSVFSGPWSGGCRWMRDQNYADLHRHCRSGCPVGQMRWPKPPREKAEAPPVVPPPPDRETIVQKRVELERDLKDLNPYWVTVVRTPAGFGKSHATLRETMERVANGERVLWFVKDTRKEDGLAASLIDDLRGKLGYEGKVQILYGRDDQNCEEWELVQRYESKGYSAGTHICRGCHARQFCGYYGQYDDVYEPGVYIAPHAMLPILFGDQRRGFGQAQVTFEDLDGRHKPIGGALSLIVIDEDALDSLVDRKKVWTGNLKRELQERKRLKLVYDSVTKTMDKVEIKLDQNWLTLCNWMIQACNIEGALAPHLDAMARIEGTTLRAVLESIDPRRMAAPDFKFNRGHKPFTLELYAALMRESEKLSGRGNFTVYTMPGQGLEIIYTQALEFPTGIPVLVLDAYAREEKYDAYLRAAQTNRHIHYLDYEVQEEANVTYVLGAHLTKSALQRAEQGSERDRKRVDNVFTALQELTSDGIETLLITKKGFEESPIWKEWEPKLPHCRITDPEAGQLYFWRGRGINAAAGKRIAVLQVPNFHPDHVFSQAAALFANDIRLDDERVKESREMVWSHNAENPRNFEIDMTRYADPRLDALNESLRLDELVQMALRNRSLTTGAEIILFVDLIDPRLPARRVLTLKEIVDNPEKDAAEARQVVYETLKELDVLNLDVLSYLGIVEGSSTFSDGKLRMKVKKANALAFNLALSYPVSAEVARKEIGA